VAQPRNKVKSLLGSTLWVPHPLRFLAPPRPPPHHLVIPSEASHAFFFPSAQRRARCAERDLLLALLPFRSRLLRRFRGLGRWRSLAPSLVAPRIDFVGAASSAFSGHASPAPSSPCHPERSIARFFFPSAQRRARCAERDLLFAFAYFTSAGVAVAGPSPTISSTASESFAPS
jgi:hypothetical protein